MRLGSSRHLFLILRRPPPGSQAARASALTARSVSAYIFVVSIDTWPNHALIVLRSTPARSRWVAVVCRIVCGLMRLDFTDGTRSAAVSPCRTLQAAVARTAPGGQILPLDSANYGHVTIKQAVSILNGRGATGVIPIRGRKKTGRQRSNSVRVVGAHANVSKIGANLGESLTKCTCTRRRGIACGGFANERLGSCAGSARPERDKPGAGSAATGAGANGS